MGNPALLVAKRRFSEDVDAMLTAQGADRISCAQSSELTLNGLHAIETTRFQIKEPHGLSHCRLSAIRRLSEAVYLDLNEIRDTRNFGSPLVLSYEDIDVERPSFLSTNHTVIIHFDEPNAENDGTEVTLSFETSYPLHFRYQQPLTAAEALSNAGYRTVDLESLEGYIQCSDDIWRKLMPETPPLKHTVHVPVGKLSDAPIVLGGTLVVSVAAFVYIFFAVLRLASRRHIARKKQKDP